MVKLDIRKQLLLGLSKSNAECIADYIGHDRERFHELIQLLCQTDSIISARAGMVLSKCADNYPHLVEPHLKQLILNLKNEIPDAVKRNTIRVLQDIEIPDPLLEVTTDALFTIMENRHEPIAVKVFTMSVLFNICLKIPELAKELKLLIEDQMPYGSAGFKNRGKKIIQKLERLMH